MLRVIVWVLGLALFVAIAVWMSDRPGNVSLTWQGWQIDTSVAFLVICVLLFSIFVAILYRIWTGLRHVPGILGAKRRNSRREKGFRTLSQGMVAVAAGDGAEARRMAGKAEALLDDPRLTRLLSAQAAQLDGDEDAARTYFNEMLDDPDTEFLGRRGLLIQAQKDGNDAEALVHAERARELRPKTPWVLTTLFDLHVRAGRWRDAMAALDQASRRKVIGGAEAARRRRLAMLGGALEAEADGRIEDALALAKKAHKAAPADLAGTLLLARLHTASGSRRPAARTIEDGWAVTPHPDLARLYLDLGPDDPLKRVQRIEKLASLNPEHPESRYAIAETALAADLWGPARQALRPLTEGNAENAPPPARACRLMAAIERSEHGDEAAAAEWLMRAASGAPDAAWMCGACGTAHGDWQAVCSHCDAFGTLDWAEPSRVQPMNADIGAGSAEKPAIAAVAPVGNAEAEAGDPPTLDHDAPPPAANDSADADSETSESKDRAKVSE